jgi:YesN/AraC family two-component response regulator
MKPSILIVDDEKVVCEGLANYLSENYAIQPITAKMPLRF